MPDTFLHFIVRTPHEVVLDKEARSIRIPTETGQVGLRPFNEPQIIAVEPGLVLCEEKNQAMDFVGTAGGLLVLERDSATLMTPLAVSGSERATITAQLQTALGEPNEEMQVRAMLEDLEEHILEEVRRKGDNLSGRRKSR